MLIGIGLAVLMIPIGIKLAGNLLAHILLSAYKKEFDGKPTPDLMILSVALITWVVIEGFLIIRLFQLAN